MALEWFKKAVYKHLINKRGLKVTELERHGIFTTEYLDTLDSTDLDRASRSYDRYFKGPPNEITVKRLIEFLEVDGQDKVDLLHFAGYLAKEDSY